MKPIIKVVTVDTKSCIVFSQHIQLIEPTENGCRICMSNGLVINTNWRIDNVLKELGVKEVD